MPAAARTSSSSASGAAAGAIWSPRPSPRSSRAETGVAVEFITGGTIDRLNKAKLAKGNPESDINFTTSHVGWLYANDDLYETLDLSKVPNAANLVEQAKISPYHIGTWAYVYTIGYRPDLLPRA